MSQAVDLEVFYPYPPKRVWQVLTDRRALATWMMENDFEPKLGHKFQFYSQPLPGLKTTIQCQVVELEEPNRLVYTWKESATAEPSLVVWTLNTVAGGTQLRLKHYQYSYTTAGARCDRLIAEPVQADRFTPTSALESLSYPSSVSNRIPSRILGASMMLELPTLQTFNWNYYLNQKLVTVLAQDVLTQA